MTFVAKPMSRNVAGLEGGYAQAISMKTRRKRVRLQLLEIKIVCVALTEHCAPAIIRVGQESDTKRRCAQQVTQQQNVPAVTAVRAIQQSAAQFHKLHAPRRTITGTQAKVAQLSQTQQ